jgi:molecular chaperone Hsp33
LVTDGIKTHDTDPIASYTFGRALTVGTLLVPLLQKNEKYSLKWDYEKKFASQYVDVDFNGCLRGIPMEPHIASKINNYDQDALYGESGSLAITKSTEGKILNSGMVEAAFMDVVDDAGFFFSVSDQIETEISVAIDFIPDPNEPVKVAAGFLLQAMPGCDLNQFEQVRNQMKTQVFYHVLQSQKMQKEKQLWKILEILLKDQQMKHRESGCSDITYEISDIPCYKCACSYEKMKQAVKVLGKEELENMFSENDKPKIRCKFCNKEYEFTRRELKL